MLRGKVFDGMTAFVTPPPGWQVPVDADGVAQFHHHLPTGSPELRFGGLEPTGPLPSAVDFPIVRGDVAGDDLGLYPRIEEVLGASGLPLRFVPGNHDIDFDPTDVAGREYTDTHTSEVRSELPRQDFREELFAN
ncbi:hypothetical protein NUM3379_39670 [Kineococcus sp. NUM-3379]